MATRITHVRKVYTYDDGETGRSAKPNWTKLSFEMLSPEKDDNDNFVVVDTRSIVPTDLSEEISYCAMGHGLSQKIGDDLAGIAGKAEKAGASFDDERGYADFIGERIDDMLENFAQGVWVAEGEGASGGGNVTILFEAMVAAFKDAGTELSEEQEATIRTKLKDEQYRKDAKAMPAVDKHVQRIAAERAAARAAKAAEKAGTNVLDADALLG